MENVNSIIESFVNRTSNINNDMSFKVIGDYSPYFTQQESLALDGYYAESVSDDIKETADKFYKAINDNFALYTRRNKIESNKVRLQTGVEPAEGNEEFKLKENFYDLPEEPKSWNKKVEELEVKLKYANSPEEINQIKQDLTALGWNPEVEYNTENRIRAKARFEKLVNESIMNISVDSDTTEYVEEANRNRKKSNKELHPISIVVVNGMSPIAKIITAVDKGDFSHAAISIDPDISKLYSFNMDNKYKLFGGFSIEDIKNYPKDGRLVVYTVFVDNDAYRAIERFINNATYNINKSTYSVINLITYPFKNININMPDMMICSQFVDTVLKMANIDLTANKSSKVSPNQLFFKVSSNPKAYKVFDGIVGDFDFKKASRDIKKFAKKALPINECTIIEGALEEARKLPIEFNDDGDVLLTNPFPDFDAEYFNSHKLLMNYDRTNNLEGMKYELARLYYMNYVLERKLYHNKMLPNKEKNIKTRARILNDFNKYIKVVSRKDRNFNFAEYYEKSPFYAHTIEVKGSTIGQIKDIIKYIL